MSKLYAMLAALFLVVLIGGTAVWTYLARTDSCGAEPVVGAAVGGAFTLVDASGATVTDAQVIDRPALVYFGYTFCPDVCPLDVSRNALAVDLLDEAGIDVKPVFITVDPERDTPEVLADYAANMHPKLAALTGTPEQVRDAAKAYRVYYAKGAGEGAFYLMDHSTFTYLMLPGKGLATYFSRNDSAEDLAARSACLIGRG